MNQERIGKLILERRKSKNLTQESLAEKLKVTSQTISKWESGQSVPALSLMKPLCKELNININELLNAEKNSGIKPDDNIFHIIDYADKKIKKSNKILMITIGTMLGAMALFFTIFSIDVNRMNNNKSVIFSTWGFNYTSPVADDDEKILSAIKDYMVTIGDSEPTDKEGVKTFASAKIYLIESETKKHYSVYAWILKEKYYLDKDQIKQESGTFMPYKLIVEKTKDDFIINSYQVPRYGKYYQEDMKNIFPDSIRTEIENAQKDDTIKALAQDLDRQIRAHYSK